MRIYICGDSTAASYPPEETEMVGWGQLLGDYLPGITVVNLAKAGRSTRTFLAEDRLMAAESAGPGDLLLIQFAHNDENEKNRSVTQRPGRTLRKTCGFLSASPGNGRRRRFC